MKNELLMQIAIKAAMSAGKILLQNYGDLKEISQKQSYRDIVTNIDKQAENAMIEILYDFDPNISIITEEQGKIINSSQNKYWLIDALDGTVNYVNQIPFFSVSVAYVENNVIIASAIYLPFYDDIYFGAREVGVFKNHKKIKSKDSSLESSLFAVTFSGKNYDSVNRSNEFQLFSTINDNSRGCLRTGSAALNLAFLAEGRLNGCWGKAAKFWDVAGGILLAELSGCKVSLVKNSQKSENCSYLATGEQLWNEVFPAVRDTLNLV